MRALRTSRSVSANVRYGENVIAALIVGILIGRLHFSVAKTRETGAFVAHLRVALFFGKYICSPGAFIIARLVARSISK